MASRVCLHRKNGFAVNWVKGSSWRHGTTSNKEILLSNGRMEWHIEVVLIKTTWSQTSWKSVHGTYNKEANEPVISWSEAIVDELGRLSGPAVLLSTTPQKWTFDRRRKDLSGRTVRLTSQDRPTVSHRGSSRMRGVRWHLDKKTTCQHLPWDLNVRTHHSSALHAYS